MSRNYKTMPEEMRNEAPGIPFDRNPGVCLVWTTRTYERFYAGNGYLFRLGDPTSTSWWTKGRKASRQEIEESIAGGLPTLRQVAELDGPEAVAEMERRYQEAQGLLPEAV